MGYIVFSIISAVVGVGGLIFGFITYTRNKKTDDATAGKQDGMILTEIGYIKAGIDDVKRDNRELRGDLQNLHDGYARLDESVKSAHRRIDKLEKYHQPN